MKKIISLLLAVMMIGAVLISCGNVETPSETTKSATATSSPADETTQDPTLDENGYKRDDLPEDLKFNEKVQILTWSEQTMWDWAIDEVTTGDNIKDAVLTRQQLASERLGVTFDITQVAGSWEVRSEFVTALYNDVNSGDSQFDIVCQYTPAGAIATVRGLYLDLNEIKYLNLSQPWWASDITEASSINGKVFTVTGDISCTLVRNMVCILTNLDMATNINAEDFYQLVKDKKWTTAKFMEYAAGSNGGLAADGSQQYTTVLQNNVIMDNVFYGAGMRFLQKDTEKGLVLSEDLTNGRVEDLYAKWRRFIANNDDVAIVSDGITTHFAPGNALFYFGQISDVQNYMQDIDYKFGILPYPLYDENQENYCTICGYWVSMFAIPISASNKDCSGAALEALGSASYRILTPAVYTVSFQYRFLNSIENAEIFDLLHDTLVFEPGRQLGDQVNVFAAFRKCADSTYDTWTSYYKENYKTWNANIKKVIRAISE